MNAGFTPSFNDFQDDIESYIISQGRSEKTADGMTIFRGYNDALNLMFRSYLEQRAYDPLLAHFRQWNWEVGDNQYLLDLSMALYQDHEWHRLQALWDSVLKKRRRLYNEMRRTEKKRPGSIPPEQVEHLKELLIETLGRLIGFAEDLGMDEDSETYARMMEQIRKGLNA
jgi:hypothetical protein